MDKCVALETQVSGHCKVIIHHPGVRLILQTSSRSESYRSPLPVQGRSQRWKQSSRRSSKCKVEDLTVYAGRPARNEGIMGWRSRLLNIFLILFQIEVAAKPGIEPKHSKLPFQEAVTSGLLSLSKDFSTLKILSPKLQWTISGCFPVSFWVCSFCLLTYCFLL